MIIREPSPMSNADILFDGVCTLCTWSVQFILRRDPVGYFQFAALQSPTGQRLLTSHGCSATSDDRVVLIENHTVYTASDAALRITRQLKGAWPVLSLLLIVPKGLRDGIYSWIATHRYRWFGRTERCMIAAPGIRDRFLDSESHEQPD
ncbi:MAG: thiol-disulfide oxidoreductase DCC family protein [Kouleothrix sp.]|jgi:predicted DCC family thiol-disulfide oxidoreductase YuxK|nr:thiol-disulfide oxidoreductase DCC family protein [Kouleothrix sp.]